MQNLYWLITIIQRSDETEYEEFYLRHGVDVTYTILCNGTAHAKTLSLLGIEKTEKAMLFSTVLGKTLAELKRALTVEMKIDLPNRGVAMAVPVSGVGGMRALEYLSGGAVPQTEEGTEEKKMQSDHELIVAIYEKGYTDLVMDAAREGGARGGTVLHAKGTADKGSTTFFGVSLAEEKEVILIVAKGDDRNSILRSIMQKAGANTPAGALAFTLPISHAAGFASAEPIPDDAE